MAIITAARTLLVMELRPGLKGRPPTRRAHAAHITLSLLAGLRTEEARALRWAHVDLDGDPAASPPLPPHPRPPAAAVQAVRAWTGSQAGEQLPAGQSWQDTGLVITTRHGAALDAGNVRKMFKRICTKAGAGTAGPPRAAHYLRQPDEPPGSQHRGIAHLAGRATTRTTEIVYRRELRPVITTGAELMDQLFTGT